MALELSRPAASGAKDMHRTCLASAILVTLAFSSVAAATDFSKVVVFGDSLNDNGNLSLSQGSPIPLRFTTNPGMVAIEIAGARLGLPVSPSVAGGTDYAWGGAGVLNNAPNTPLTAQTVTAQVNSYLADVSIDPKALYAIWGGANDIFFHATAVAASSTAQQLIASNIAAAVAQARAQGLPDSQVANFTAQITPVITAQINAGVAAQAGVPASAFETPGQAQAAIAATAQQEVTLIGKLQGAGVRNLLVFNLPNIGLTPSARAQGPDAANQLAGLGLIYNGVLQTGLSQMDVGIIPINAYALLNEVVANPAAYGFTNVTDAACGVEVKAVQCGPQGSGLPYSYPDGADQTYLFADGVHPTTAAHAMLGSYVVSVLAAPGQVSLLGEAPLAATGAQYRTIRNQLLADGHGSDTRFFASVDVGHQRFDATSGSPHTDSDNVSLMLGTDARVNDNVSIGVALSLGQHNADFAGNAGGYKMQDISGLGYALYHNGGGYVGGFGSFGQSNFSDVNRRILLGQALRTEGGKADGSHLGGGLEGGWWFGTGSLKTGPFAHVEWQTVKIDSYTESGADSTAMWFGAQQRDALIESLGWRLQGQWQAGGATLMPYVELAWNHDDKADPREVRAGLVSMPGSFALTGYVPDKTWASADVGLSAQFSPNVTGWFGYHGRFSDDTQKDDSLNLGVKVGF
ncbi:autotransporter domain-containing protein [Frateuria sp. GZRR35]|uniref:autotransporter domain-containing protein n=1 Tax=Frateuria sp. GZRR35 TaxID=3351536 RepID=UPI003EDB6F31